MHLKSPSASLSMPHWNRRIVHIIILAIVLVFSGGWVDAHVASAATNNVIYVDGVTYPYTAAGVQAAVNNVPTPNGEGGVVMLPAADIPLGSTSLTMRKHVCLIGVSSDSSSLTYNGAGAAIVFPPGMVESCLKQLTVGLGGRAGANAVAISLQGDFNNGLPDVYLKIQDVSVWTGSLQPGQIGMSLMDSAGAPSGIQLSWFDTIKVVNFGQPIVVNGQEGNFWNNIHINGFSSVAISDADSNDNFWQLRITGNPPSPSSTGFREAGALNQIHLTCDFGIEAQSCINDAGAKNIWDVSALTPVGRIASSSHYRGVGASYGSIPSSFQVSSSAITGASSTIRSGAPGCLEIANSDGSTGMNYITFLNGVASVTTTKPQSCR